MIGKRVYLKHAVITLSTFCTARGGDRQESPEVAGHRRRLRQRLGQRTGPDRPPAHHPEPGEGAPTTAPDRHAGRGLQEALPEADGGREQQRHAHPDAPHDHAPRDDPGAGGAQELGDGRTAQVPDADAGREQRVRHHRRGE